MIVYSQNSVRQRGPVEKVETEASAWKGSKFAIPERDEKIRELWLAGLSAAEIARQTGYSHARNVIHRANRLGLPPRKK